MFDLLVRGGYVVDGTGALPRRADVGVIDGRIAQIGDLTGGVAATTIGAAGLVVTPGFIDFHQHADVTPLIDGRCVSALSQGVTSIVVGNCGHGVSPGSDRPSRSAAIIGFRESWGLDLGWPTYASYFRALDAARPGVNIAAFAGHGAVRVAVMSLAQQSASRAELDRMAALVDEAMSAGAVGLSSGLEYSPGMYADQAELTLLCRVVARYGGAYATHIRGRGDSFVAAVEEAIAIAEASGVRLILSHIAPRPYAPTGTFPLVQAKIEKARADGLHITIDTFPDEWGPSPLASVLPSWITAGTGDDVLRRLRQPDIVAAARAAFDGGDNFLLRVDGPSRLRLSSSAAHPELVGQTLSDIGQAWKKHLADVVCDLLLHEGDDFYTVLIQHRYATRRDLDVLYEDPFCAFESDGIVTAPDGPLSNLVMNRSTYGYTARVLSELVYERQLISLEEGIRRMTSLPAAAVGTDDRGLLRKGAAADIVVLDPPRVRDRSSDLQPAASPTGIAAVVVNGRVAYSDGLLTGDRAGRFLEVRV